LFDRSVSLNPLPPQVTLLKDAFVKLAFDYKPKMGKVGG
jgi:hypothetical protein